ncbi:cellulose-binding protein [Streptomyces sp. NPDC052095]|uniref:cellulose-binding protein n=1 Tax=unclassified Streptomyces TaxID=2593676 RepID=UPI00344DA175
MSSVPVSAHGFVGIGVRGRGYRPEQVDRAVSALSAERDEALAEVDRLTTLVAEMSAESVRLAEVVATLAPQTYESLGERAQQILALAEGEAASVRGAARDRAQELRDAAETAGREVRAVAGKAAEAIRAEAVEYADGTLTTARKTADAAVADAREEAAGVREKAGAMMAETVSRTASVLAHQEQEHAERLKTAQRELADAETGQTARHDDLTERAEARLAEARRALAETEEAARHGQEDAEARAAELIAEARVREERVVRETERVVREHDEGREQLHAHMAHVRNSLAALTGRVTAPADELDN